MGPRFQVNRGFSRCSSLGIGALAEAAPTSALSTGWELIEDPPWDFLSGVCSVVCVSAADADALEAAALEGDSNVELQEGLMSVGLGVCSRVSVGVCAGVRGPVGAVLGGGTMGELPRGRM